jgi:hypothetical protein
MKKRSVCLSMVVGLALTFLFGSGTLFAGSENVFMPEIERAVDRAVAAWAKEDPKGLKAALERLTLNETYLMAVCKSDKERSYLARVPVSLANDFSSVGAYLFLIRKEREGILLWPVAFFEGKSFRFQRGVSR